MWKGENQNLRYFHQGKQYRLILDDLFSEISGC